MSATHSRSGATGAKCLFTRSCGPFAAGSAMVVRLTLPRLAPRSPSSPMSRSTVHLATGDASSARSRLIWSQTLRAP